jgi:hypothetical protein
MTGPRLAHALRAEVCWGDLALTQAAVLSPQGSAPGTTNYDTHYVTVSRQPQAHSKLYHSSTLAGRNCFTIDSLTPKDADTITES